jgi:hypothetical protein
MIIQLEQMEFQISLDVSWWLEVAWIRTLLLRKSRFHWNKRKGHKGKFGE